MQEIGALPIPNWDAPRLRMFAGFAPIADLARGAVVHPKVQALIDKNDDEAKEQILRMQEQAYKLTAKEKHADAFAAAFMKDKRLNQ